MLSVENLGVYVRTAGGRLTLVEDVSFTVPPGRTLGVVGESGSGKSMLSLAVIGLLPGGVETTGRVVLDGEELTGLPESVMCRRRGKSIGMIFQEPMTALNPVMTVGNQIAEGLIWHEGVSRRAARATALDLLNRVGLPDAARRLDDFPHELSGGQRQRVGIAIALACRPRLLIADEPTTALDVTVQAQILDLLRDLVCEFDMGLILVSHDLGVIAEIADDTMVMYAGSPVELGATSSIFAAPAHPYTRGLFKAMPGRKGPVAGRMATIPGSVPDPADRPAGCRFAPRCPFAVSACTEGFPGWSTVGEGWQARCIRLEDLP